MNSTHVARFLSLSSIALALAGCGSDDHHQMPMPPVQQPQPQPQASPGDVLALTASNRIVSFNRDAPATVRTSVAVNGLQNGENLVGIDVRPADGLLYGVGSSGRLYVIDAATGVATLKSTLSADATDTTAPFTALAGTDFGVDFNPVADRLRVVGNTGQNLRINVDTGATTTDGNINGGAAGSAIAAVAYTNSFAGTAGTTLFGIDTANDLLYVQNPPNNGTLATPVSLGVDAAGAVGFDIDARTNTGYVVTAVGAARNLYSVNLGAGANAATLVGAVGVSEDIRGIALRAVNAPVVLALSDDNRLLGFRASTPNTLDMNVTVGGLGSGETLLGIDVRPKDGMLYGLTSAARIVTIDPATGAASVKATLAADPADASSPYAALAGMSFAVDFNPVADRLRVISNTGQSLRINPDSGATTTDGAVNLAGTPASVSAAAYTNSVPGASTTQLFDLDGESNMLALQNPPNDGTLTNVGMLGVDIAGDNGFDIGGGANGLALAALRTSATGPSTLYRIDLATGAATPVNGTATPASSRIGTGTGGVRDIAIWIR